MTKKLWLNYLIYGIVAMILIWLLIDSGVQQEPLVFAFLMVILIGPFFIIPHETRLRQLLNTDRLAGLERRVAQKKYEYVVIAIILIISGLLYMYYKSNDLDTSGLFGFTVAIFGAAVGTSIRHFVDRQEIKELKEKATS
ncbi:hypothetical protein [Macrococcus armenti]|uniref:hypothetical protein n=1 Tax=Macrococcus armenti TaxID=2875764 RepID=UPI001CCFE59B|nr:hypothetical protein [Macrococcus armenti]UBH08300.1 hypothetical protein LAU41_09970 [Macrococcus armenti]UBH10531.1 hypothetical protein LAU38_09890 [Macrococcus armenti]